MGLYNRTIFQFKRILIAITRNYYYYYKWCFAAIFQYFLRLFRIIFFHSFLFFPVLCLDYLVFDAVILSLIFSQFHSCHFLLNLLPLLIVYVVIVKCIWSNSCNKSITYFYFFNIHSSRLRFAWHNIYATYMQPVKM